ncbi:TlpA family protein disulfide reductase [Enterovirga sp. GCM10030262]|uniref:TlpA family protein disulfide reductase n=1 Tax=Enterovirga sp. GCM10030262 TaxID=3273391 RepID=UPI00360D0939
MRLIACLLGLGLLLAGCDRQKPDGPQGGGAPSDWAGPRLGQGESAGRLDRSHAGAPAPASAFENPEGGPATLADFRGKPLLVNLWATWCAPCIAEMPTLDALAAREDTLQVLVVSQDLEGQAKVDAFFAERKFSTLQPYIDPNMELMTALGVDTLPTTILYDSEGKEVWRMTGIEDWQGARAAELIAEASPAA